MKWFRITSIVWQIVIFLSLVTLLNWDSTPVPGLDGRVICDLYEFPCVRQQEHGTVTIFETNGIIALVRSYAGNSFVPFICNAPIVKTSRIEPIPSLKWLVDTVPLFNDILPKRLRCRIDGGWVIGVSLTLDEWKILNEKRRKNTHPIGCQVLE